MKTTREMVQNALIELHGTKGVTLKQIYNFISTTNNLESLTSNRINLIKKYLKTLQETEDIVNKTGKGLIGHFKLADKVKFIKNIETNIQQTKKNINTKARVKERRKSLKEAMKQPAIARANALVIPRTTTRRQVGTDTHSVFDTPIIPSQVSSSTPFVKSPLIPWAPEVSKRSANNKLSDIETETPRSSLPTRKRRLRHNSEQIF